MSAIIATVSRIAGEFSIQRVDGSIVEASKNSEIYEGDTVRGSGNPSELNSLVINMVDGADVVMIGDESQLFDSSLLQTEFAENETVTEIESVEAMVEDSDFIVNTEDDTDNIDTEAGEEDTLSSSTDTPMANFSETTDNSVDINAQLRDADTQKQKTTQDNDYEPNRVDTSHTDTLNAEITDIVSNMSDLMDAANAAATIANDTARLANSAAEAARLDPTVENLEEAERAQQSANLAAVEAASTATELNEVIESLKSLAASGEKTINTVDAEAAVLNANAAATTASNAAISSEITTDSEIANMVSNVSVLTNIASIAAENANAAAVETKDAVELANENPTLENLNSAKTLQEAAALAATRAVDAAEELENSLDALNEAADAANEIIDSEVLSVASIAVDSADNSADNANQSANLNLNISSVVDSDSSDNTINENVADGTYAGVTLNAVDVDGDAVVYNVADGVPFSVNADGQVVTSGEIDFETTPSYTFDVTAKSADGSSSTQEITINVDNINEAPVISDTQTVSMTEDSLEGFSGYGATWSGDIYSIITQEEMLNNLNISDVDSSSFSVTLANTDDGSSYHHGIQATDSTFSNPTTNVYDEQVIQITQGFLDTYPQIDAQVGDFYFDNVAFDSLSEGESANISFEVVVSDGEITSEAKTVNIAVIGSNDTPTITVTDTTVTEDIAQVIANVSDIDGTIDAGTLTAENGTVTISENGDITYTPEADYNGTDTVNISVTDNGGATTTQTFTVEVAGVNDVAVAIDDGSTDVGNETAGAAKDVTVTGIYRNGSDENVLDGVDDALVTSKAHSYFEHGSFGHTGYNYMGGHDYFADNDISFNDFKGGVITFSDGTVGVIDAASNGVVRDRDGDGEIDYEESAYIYYNAADNIEIGQAYYETTEDRALRVDVLSNDSDVDGDSLTLMDVQNPVTNADGVAIGTATISGGNVIFTPNDEMDKLGAGEHEDVSFTYTVSDGNGERDTATVNVKVMGTNDGPVVGDDIDLGSVNEDNSVEFTQAQLLVNSSDIDTNDVLSVNSLSSENGTIVDLGDGNYRFIPNENYNGDVDISFNVNDGHTNVATNAALRVDAVNDAVVANDDGKVDGTIDTHADYGDMIAGAGNSVTVTGIYAARSNVNMLDGKPELETLNDYRFVGDNQDRGYNYMGNHDYFSDNEISTSQMRGGVITFSDGSVGIIDSASNGVERDRDGDGDIDYEENAYIYYKSYEDLDSSTLLTNEDTSITVDVLANDTDADGDTFSITQIQGQDVINNGAAVDVTDLDANVLGTAQIVDGQIQFNPTGTLQSLNDGEEQNVTFEYTISDEQGGQESATVTVNVDGVNERPVAIDDNPELISYDIPEGGTIVSSDENVTVVKGEIVSEGETLSSVDHWTFIHNGGPLTIDTLSESGNSFVDIDGDGSKDHIDTMMRLYDGSGNNIAVNDDSKLGTEDGSTNDYYAHIQDSYINLDNLPAGEYTLAIGSWDLSDAEVQSNQNDNITFREQDIGPYQISFIGDVSFDYYTDLSVIEDNSLTINSSELLVNDVDVDGGSLSVTDVIATANTHGSVILDANGNIVFTPHANYNGDASFEYVVSDGQNGFDTATVTLNVQSDGNNTELISTSMQTQESDSIILGDGNDVVNAQAGNDYIDAGAGTDRVYAGAGDDTINLDASDSVMDGGEGLDTLVVEGETAIDFSGLSDNISNIETIDLGVDEQNITSLSTEDVLDMTDTDNLLRIDGELDADGNKVDSIDLNTQGADAEWTLGDFKTDAETGQTYQEVTGVEDDVTVILEISTDIQIDQN